jgi:hypothetical protein
MQRFSAAGINFLDIKSSLFLNYTGRLAFQSHKLTEIGRRGAILQYTTHARRATLESIGEHADHLIYFVGT